MTTDFTNVPGPGSAGLPPPMPPASDAAAGAGSGVGGGAGIDPVAAADAGLGFVNPAGSDTANDPLSREGAERRSALISAARGTARVVRQDYAGAAMIFANSAKSIVKTIVIPILVLFLLIGYALNPRQLFYAAQSFFAEIRSEFVQEYIVRQTGVEAFDSSFIGRYLETGGSIASMIGSRVSALFGNADDDSTSDTGREDENYLDELNYTSDASMLNLAMSRRLQAVKNRVNARVLELQLSTSLPDLLELMSVWFGSTVDVSQCYGTVTYSWGNSSSSMARTQQFKNYTALQMLAVYSIQKNADSSADLVTTDTDGNVKPGDSLADFLKWVGYQDESTIEMLLGHFDYPWKGTFLPQALYEERLRLQSELDTVNSQLSHDADNRDLNAQRNVLELKIQQCDEYATSLLNYIITVSQPSTYVVYEYYDSNGLRTHAPVTDEDGNVDSSHIARTNVVITMQSSVRFASNEEVTQLVGFWSGDKQGNTSGNAKFEFNTTLAAQDSELIGSANGTEDSETATETATGLMSEADMESAIAGDVSESGTGSDADGDQRNELNHFDVDDYFEQKRTYYNDAFGYSSDLVGRMKAALKWGRDSDGYLIWNRDEFGTLSPDEWNSTSAFRDQMVELAESQLGHRGGLPYASSDDDAWCTEFVVWLGKQLGLCQLGVIPDVDYSGALKRWFQQRDQWKPKNSGYIPQAGDIILYDWEGDGSTDHTGLVVRYDPSNETVYTIEGNVGNVCKRQQHYKGSSSIAGYCVPEYP